MIIILPFCSTKQTKQANFEWMKRKHQCRNDPGKIKSNEFWKDGNKNKPKTYRLLIWWTLPQWKKTCWLIIHKQESNQEKTLRSGFKPLFHHQSPVLYTHRNTQNAQNTESLWYYPSLMLQWFDDLMVEWNRNTQIKYKTNESIFYICINRKMLLFWKNWKLK